MPTRDLTDRFCASAKAVAGAAQTDFYDAQCAGLALRVSARRKSWTYLFLWKGERIRWTFGTYPAMGLAKARTSVDEAKAEIADGRDPRAALAAPETLRAIAEEWLDREGRKLRTGEDRRAVLERAILPVLGNVPIKDIRRSAVVRLLDAIEDSAGPSAADKALEVLRRVFNFHAARSDDFSSPIVRGMSRSKPHERSRNRILTDDELRTVWHTAGGQGAFGRMVRFILLTAARRTEASAMMWTELADGDWTLPAARNKTKLDLVRPLPPLTLAQLGERSSEFVFSSNGLRPLTGYAELKLAFDRAVTAGLGAPLPNWTLHDLRRTARSLMSRAGVPSDHAERVLGHVIGGVRGVCDRYEYHDEKADALARLSQLVDRIVTGKPMVLTPRRINREAEANG
jgi:integrase